MFKQENIKKTSEVENEQLSIAERSWRDSELKEFIDHYQKPLVWEELTEEQKTKVKGYRTTLLYYPNNVNFPNIERPTRPSL